MKKIKRFLIMIMIFMYNPIIALADSGSDSNYESSDSIIGSLFSSIGSLLSFLGQLLTEQPGGKDYLACHIILGVLCIITIYTVTAVQLFKLDRKKKTKKETGNKFLLSLIPVVIFSLVCFLTELQLILYLFILILYIILLIIVIKIMIKNKIKKQLNNIRKIDKSFNEEEFNKEAFKIYKELQLAWIDTNIDKVKEIISEDLYNKNIKKLEELKKNNQKNIMKDIEYKSNKIVDIRVKDNIETITCEMNVSCIDYIVDDKEKVVKGKSDKTYKYLYELRYNKDLKTNKYTLTDKKMKKIK